MDGSLSALFSIERGVSQGSVLSPTLFNVVIDPLWKSLEASSLGLCVNGLYGGAYLHADALSTSLFPLNAQIKGVVEFANRNFLQLNPSKCEIVPFAQSSKIQHPCEIEGKELPASGINLQSSSTS